MQSSSVPIKRVIISAGVGITTERGRLDLPVGPSSPAVGCAGLSVEKEATIQMASFCSCQLSLMTTLMTILDS